MAHLWIFGPDDGWTTRMLGGPSTTLAAAVPECVAAAAAGLALRQLADPPRTWALVTREPTARLNGRPVRTGLAVLQDRDQIRVPGVTAWFSTELLAQVEPYPAEAHGRCPRCKQLIDAEASAVKCPFCGLWHHASDDLPCWTYAATCAACPQATALDAGYRWTPEEL